MMAAPGVTQFQLCNPKIFRFFRICGIWQVHHNEKTHYVNPLGFAFTRLIWISWYIIGTALGILVKQYWSKREGDTSKHHFGIFLDMAAVLMMFMLVGPVQIHILMRNHQFLPIIFNDISKLEKLPLGPGANLSLRKPDIKFRNQYHYDDSTDITDSESSDDCCSSSNISRILQKIMTFIYIGAILAAFGTAMWYETVWADTKDEYKWVIIMFYMVFPILTTWFSIFLIKHHEAMYKVIQNIEDKEFEDPTTIRQINDYMSKLHLIFEKMNDNIFQFTLGINFAIFVLSGAISMFELLQGLEEKRHNGTELSDIIYVNPLAICIYHIFMICNASDSLFHNAHDQLRLKLKDHMPRVLMPQPKPTDWTDKPFKKIELLYKDLKYWRPQVTIYGGYKVNYQICSGIIFFIFAYAKVFIKIAHVKHGAGHGNVTTIPGLHGVTTLPSLG